MYLADSMEEANVGGTKKTQEMWKRLLRCTALYPAAVARQIIDFNIINPNQIKLIRLITKRNDSI